MVVRLNPVCEKLLAGKPVYGFHTGFSSPDLLEFCGSLGFDWCWLDAEHYPAAVDATAHLVRACETVGVVPMVRVGINNPYHILQYLDTGMMGVLVPNIGTVEDARRAVEAVRYPPLGRRSSSAPRAARYLVKQTEAEYIEWANRNVLLIGIIEQAAGFENLPGILSVEGMDGIYPNPTDLAVSFGLSEQFEHPRVRSLMAQADQQVLVSGKLLLALAHTSDEAKQARANGAKLISIGVPTLLRQAGRAFLDSMRA